MTSRISSFITELRRRRVFRVAAFYGGIAFVIIQIIDGTFDLMGVPEWVGRMMVVLIALGFPISMILAWVFDITPEGIVRTKGPQRHKPRHVSHPIVIGNRALGIIASLAILIAAWSWWQKEQDPLSAFEHSVVVMPFTNLTNDTDFDVWGKGVASLIIDDLTVYEDLYVMDSQTIFEIINTIEQNRKAQVLPEMAKEVADITGIRMLLLGDILKAGSTLLLQSRLVDARTGQVIFSHQVKGGSEDDLPTMAQSLSERIRNHLEIGIIERYLDVDFRAPRVQSAKAYRLYTQGMEDFILRRFHPAIEALQQAVATDSLLGAAHIFLSYAYTNYGMIDSARAVFDRAYPRKGDFTRLEERFFDYERAMQDKDIYKAIRIMEQILPRNPINRGLMYELGLQYLRLDQFDKAIAQYKRALELSDQWGGWKWLQAYTELGIAYHATGQHRKELKVYKRGLELLPEHPTILRRYAIHYLSVGDTSRAAPYLERYQLKGQETGWSETAILNGLGGIYWGSGLLTQAIVTYQKAIEADPAYHWPYSSLGFILVDNDMNVEEGLRLIETALDLKPENLTHLYRKGWGLYKQGRYTEALELLERSWELRLYYNHDHYLHLQAARKAVAEGKK